VRVLIVNKFAEVRGGADRHCLELFEALRDAGHEAAFLSTAGAGHPDRPGAYIPRSVTTENRGALGPGAAQRVARRCLWNTTAAAATVQTLDHFRADVVHLHKLYPQLSVAPAVIAARRGLPVIQTLHDYELLAGEPLHDGEIAPPAGAVSRPERVMAAALNIVHRKFHRPSVAAWVAGSDHVARVYARIGIEAAVLALPIASPDGQLPTFSARRGVVFAGRFSAEKGPLDAVELARRAPQLEVTVMGSGPLTSTLRECAASLPNLHVVGPAPTREVSLAMASARVVVVPSRWAEPVGLSALEAMAVGTPVVAYAVGGLAEQVAGAGGGVLTAPDPAALTEACRAVHDEQRRWAALSSAGRSHVAREHQPARYVKRLLGVYVGAGAPV
jgi:glycosyltransferase involved in cell wall biosynthesis